MKKEFEHKAILKAPHDKAEQPKQNKKMKTKNQRSRKAEAK